MSRVFTDPDLLTWEAYASAGAFGLPEQPKIVFHCISDPHRPARFVTHDGDNATAEQEVHSAQEDRLREMLAASAEL